MHARLAQELKEGNGFVPNHLRSTAYLFRCVSTTVHACLLPTYLRMLTPPTQRTACTDA